MKVLVCGAGGFIGRHVVQQLRASGHSVREGRAPEIDFSRDLEVSAWLPHIAGMDAVINAVGVLRDSRARPMNAIHHLAPAALFEACAQQGVRRVVHISALGIEGNPTLYARSKLGAETVLTRLHEQGRLTATILRPSIVFGRGGASSELFMRLASLPILVLPGAALRAKVQPVAVRNVADAAVAMLNANPPLHLDCVGPQQLTLAEFVACLRAQLGRRAAPVLATSDWLSRLSARCGDHLPFQPWCSETLALLQKDNVGEAAAFAGLLQHPAIPPRELVRSEWNS
jgi:uncharacterized protein YbjT (DUF2867 family)